MPTPMVELVLSDDERAALVRLSRRGKVERRTADRAIAAGRLRATDAEALLDVLVPRETAGASS